MVRCANCFGTYAPSPLTCLLCHSSGGVRCNCFQPAIIEWPTDSEVVKALPSSIGDAQYLVHSEKKPTE